MWLKVIFGLIGIALMLVFVSPVVIKIKSIANAFTVYPDPAASEPDDSDMRYAFIVEDVQREEYLDRYGEASMSSLDEFMSQGAARDCVGIDSEFVELLSYCLLLY